MEVETDRGWATLLPYVLLFGAIYSALLVVVGMLARLAGLNSPAVEVAILVASATLVANRYVRKHNRYWDHQQIVLFAFGAVLIKTVCALGFLLVLPEFQFGIALLVITAFIGGVHWLVLYAFLRWPAQRLSDKWLRIAEPQPST